MGFIDFPDPISIFEGAKNSGFEREEINAFVSGAYSAWIAGVWRAGSSKFAQFFGIGQALKDSATAMYLSLTNLEKKNFLCLTIPQDMLAADNLSKFQTESKAR